MGEHKRKIEEGRGTRTVLVNKIKMKEIINKNTWSYWYTLFFVHGLTLLMSVATSTVVVVAVALSFVSNINLFGLKLCSFMLFYICFIFILEFNFIFFNFVNELFVILIVFYNQDGKNKRKKRSKEKSALWLLILLVIYYNAFWSWATMIPYFCCCAKRKVVDPSSHVTIINFL